MRHNCYYKQQNLHSKKRKRPAFRSINEDNTQVLECIETTSNRWHNNAPKDIHLYASPILLNTIITVSLNLAFFSSARIEPSNVVWESSSRLVSTVFEQKIAVHPYIGINPEHLALRGASKTVVHSRLKRPRPHFQRWILFERMNNIDKLISLRHRWHSWKSRFHVCLFSSKYRFLRQRNASRNPAS